MGDYLLDFRDPEHRRPAAERLLLFFPDLKSERIRTNRFELILTHSGGADLWAPYISPDGTIVALAGRIALDPADWTRAEAAPGDGGLACKAIYQLFQAGGFDGIRRINGGYAIHIFEPAIDRYSLILDPAGCYPSYCPTDSHELVYSSHPDALAVAIDCTGNWNYGSLAVFLSTGQVTHPYTYYTGVVGLEHGIRYIMDLSNPELVKVDTEKIAPSIFRVADDTDEEQLAADLASAVSRTVKQITQPRLGRTFIALSGGLDSRLIASQANLHKNLRSFCIRGARKNKEFRTANAIADAIGIEMVPMIRSFDHYADHAEMGVRISGGMGNISSNHYLGFRDRLRELGCDNLVTGCYFDYLFKSLAIDAQESRWLRREHLTGYKYSSYLPYIPPIRKYERIVQQRLNDVVPEDLAACDSDDCRLQIAAKRTFPLWREGDNIQRLIAQRVFAWYSPAIFQEILDVYWRTPISARLDKSIFKKVLIQSIGPELLRIPDNNTERRIDASPLIITVFRYQVALRRLIERYRHDLDTEESWINWTYYLRHSHKIHQMWNRTQPDVRKLIEELTGHRFSEDLDTYLRVSTDYFLRLLTLMLWAEQRN